MVVFMGIASMEIRKYGHLTLLKMGASDNKGRKKWLCRCVCGNEKEYAGRGLRKGYITSCGCKGLGKPGIIPRFWYSQKRAHAKCKNKTWRLDYDLLCNLFVEQNNQCAISGLPLYFSKTKKEWETLRNTTASIDRIDSNIGYLNENVWWVHKDINNIKQSMSTESLVEICSKIVKNYTKDFIDNNQYIYGEVGLSYIFKSCQRNALVRNIEFKLSIEDIKQQFFKQYGLCALTKDPLYIYNRSYDYRTKNTASIDRINSSLPYEKDNIWFVTKTINNMKWSYSLDYFLFLCESIDNKWREK